MIDFDKIISEAIKSGQKPEDLAEQFTNSLNKSKGIAETHEVEEKAQELSSLMQEALRERSYTPEFAAAALVLHLYSLEKNNPYKDKHKKSTASEYNKLHLDLADTIKKLDEAMLRIDKEKAMDGEEDEEEDLDDKILMNFLKFMI
ncbi:MAG: hypothetical protein NC548_22830 [Lachnospiraceae bacterium]|nr:hypothetical protein [Lachnospiraceae bacterium]